MKRVILLFVSLAVMAFQLLFAQSFTVKGKVIAEEGNEPLIGVSGFSRLASFLLSV